MISNWVQRLTSLAIGAKVSPPVLADALEFAPEFYAPGTVLALVRLTGGFAVLYNFGQMDRHVAVNIQDLTVHDETTETSNETLSDRRSSQMFTGREQTVSNVYRNK